MFRNFLGPILPYVSLFILLPLAGQSAASWQLNEAQSLVSFVTVKANHVAEVHRLPKLSGAVDDEGVALIDIDPAAVDTLIPIRNERMREFLFDVARFPNIAVRGQVALQDLESLAVGETAEFMLPAQLLFKNKTVDLAFTVRAARLGASRLLVSTRQPTIVNAAQLDAVAGVEKLRELAGLPSISQAVPVTFELLFEQSAAAKQ